MKLTKKSITFYNGKEIPAQFYRSTEVILIVDSFAENVRGSKTVSGNSGNGDADSNGHGDSDEQSEGSSVSRLRYILTTGNECKVNIGPEFLQALAEVVGDDNYDLKVAKTRKPSGQNTGR